MTKSQLIRLLAKLDDETPVLVQGVDGEFRELEERDVNECRIKQHGGAGGWLEIGFRPSDDEVTDAKAMLWQQQQIRPWAPAVLIEAGREPTDTEEVIE